MATAKMKTKANQNDTDQPSHIIIGVDYETKLIMPMEEGLEFIRIWATARELKEPYNKPKKIQAVEKDFQMRFVSERQIKQMIVEGMLDTDNGD